MAMKMRFPGGKIKTWKENIRLMHLLANMEIEGGSLVKPFQSDSKERYVQCIAETGLDSVKIIPTAEEGTKITVGGKEIKSGEAVELKLKENGYGYVTVDVKTSSQDGSIENCFILAVLKPAPNQEILYGLENRPRFHYTAPYGYINDPNGMMYNAQTKEYHLFYQAFPYEQKAGAKHWGHATTRDLVTFKEHSTALYPDDSGAMWSGTGIIDYNNVAGLYDESSPSETRMILFYYSWKQEATSAGIAYTPDEGETWIKAYDGRKLNFIGQQPGHIDPKVFWHEEANTWVMICACGYLYTSKNLWDWTYNSSDMGYECPDFYKIRVEETKEIKYVRSYSGTFYRIGRLQEDSNGMLQFVPESEELRYNGDSLDRRNGATEKYGWFSGKLGVVYATQHYTEAPDDRIISVSWLVERGLDTSGTWAGAMTVAMEQKLHEKKDGSCILYSYPVEEIKSLRKDCIYSCEDIIVKPESENILEHTTATYADIDGSFTMDPNVTEFGFHLRTGTDGGDITIKYDVIHEMLIADYSNSKHHTYNGVRTMRMELGEERTVSIRILLDSIIVESFGNDGEVSISSVFYRDKSYEGMGFYTIGGNLTVKKLEIYAM